MRFQTGKLGLTLVVIVALVVCQRGCLTPPDATDPPPSSRIAIRLQLFATGFASPVAIEFALDDTGRAFVVDQIGVIYKLDSTGRRAVEPFLDIRDRLVLLSPLQDERGLLGLAFHPDYAANGRFFVYYTAPKDADDPLLFDSENRLSEFRVSANDPDRADLGSERVLLDLNQPSPNHHAGQLAFGPDGYLYIATGDGGGGGDVGVGHTIDTGNGQDLSSLHGKILRIDVDGGEPYAIPPDNPFVDVPFAGPEIWAYGLRNPWRFSFDSQGDHRLFVGDVGQALFEEVDLITRGGNYGWNRKEGSRCFDPLSASNPPQSCADTGDAGEPLIDPVMEYSHVDAQGQPTGISVIGGYVYRGSAVRALQGQYVFADYSRGPILPDGSLFVAEEADDGTWTPRELSVAGPADHRIGRFVLALGRDPAGELYVLTSNVTGPAGTTGAVLKIVPVE